MSKGDKGKTPIREGKKITRILSQSAPNLNTGWDKENDTIKKILVVSSPEIPKINLATPKNQSPSFSSSPKSGVKESPDTIEKSKKGFGSFFNLLSPKTKNSPKSSRASDDEKSSDSKTSPEKAEEVFVLADQPKSLMDAIERFRKITKTSNNNSPEENALILAMREYFSNGEKPDAGYEHFLEFTLNRECFKNKLYMASENYTPRTLQQMFTASEAEIQKIASGNFRSFKTAVPSHKITQSFINTFSTETLAAGRDNNNQVKDKLKSFNVDAEQLFSYLNTNHKNLKAILTFPENLKQFSAGGDYAEFRLNGDFFASVKTVGKPSENGVQRYLRQRDEVQKIKDDLLAEFKKPYFKFDDEFKLMLAKLDNKTLAILKEETLSVQEAAKKASNSTEWKIAGKTTSDAITTIDAKITANDKIINSIDLKIAPVVVDNSDYKKAFGKQLLELLSHDSKVPNKEKFAKAKELIDAGADLNLTDKNGRTALHKAAHHGHLNIVRELIAAGADVNKEDKKHHTAYEDANRSHKKYRGSIVQELLDSGAEVRLHAARLNDGEKHNHSR